MPTCTPHCSAICNIVSCSVCHSVSSGNTIASVTTPVYFEAGSGSVFDVVKLRIKQFRDIFGNTSATLPTDRTEGVVVTDDDWNALVTYANAAVSYKVLACTAKQYSCSCDWNWLCSQCGSVCGPDHDSYDAVDGKTVSTTTPLTTASSTSINTNIIDKLNQRKKCASFQVTCSTHNCGGYCASHTYCDCDDNCGSDV